MVRGGRRIRLAGLGAALGCGALLALGGCAGGGTAKEDQFTESNLLLMLTILPGRYDNTAQAELDVRNGVHPVHEAVVLVITHVYAPRIGKYVYYAQESAADNPNRVLAQRVWEFELKEKRGVQQTLYELAEPARWRDGYLNKDLFTALQFEDVQLEACKLMWIKKGDTFTAANDAKFCPASAAATTVPQMELTAGGISIGDYKFVRKGR
jgi:CpeT/CpcT family (DUF1001)